MRKFTFSYSVIEWNTVNGEDICEEVSSVSFEEELTEEQADRLNQSYNSGNKEKKRRRYETGTDYNY